MPFVFAIVGIGFLIVAIRGTHAQAFGLLRSEFTGPQNFVTWALALFILGALGYVPVIRPVTRAMMLLVLLVIVLRNGTGFFAQFNRQINNPTAPEPMPSTPPPAPTAPTMTPPQFRDNTPSGRGGLTLPEMQTPSETWRRFLFGR